MSDSPCWSCPACTLENPSAARRCAACQRRRPPSNAGLVEGWIQKRRRQKRKRKSPSSAATVTVRIVMESAELHTGQPAFWVNQPLEALNPSLVNTSSGRKVFEPAIARKSLRKDLRELSDLRRDGAKRAEPTNNDVDHVGGDTEAFGTRKTPCIQSNDDEKPVLSKESNKDESFMVSGSCNHRIAVSPAETSVDRMPSTQQTDDANDSGGRLEEACQATDETASAHLPKVETCTANGCGQPMMRSHEQQSSHCTAAPVDGVDENSSSIDPPPERRPGMDAISSCVAPECQASYTVEETAWAMEQDGCSREDMGSQEGQLQNAAADTSQETAIDDPCSSSQEDADLHFSQLLSQPPAGFMYTQAMSQIDETAAKETDDETAPRLPAEETLISETAVPVSCARRPIARALDSPCVPHSPIDQKMRIFVSEGIESDGELMPSPACRRRRLSSNSVSEGGTARTTDKVLNYLAQPIDTPVVMSEVRAGPGPGQERLVEESEASVMQAAQLRVHPPREATDVKNHSPVEFQTAGSHSTIHVSVDSMERASNVLGSEATAKAEADTTHNGRAGFLTAGSRSRINVSSESLSKAAHILDTGETPSLVVSWRPPVVAFHTVASKKRISVSEQSIAKGSAILGAESARQILRDVPIKEGPASPLQMFRTAGHGRAVQVSEESKARAAKILHDGTDSTLRTSFLMTEGLPMPSAKPKPLLTFQTAGSRTSITTSEESRVNASRILAKTDSRGNHSADGQADCIESHAQTTFRTAGSRAQISISDESLSVANSLLKDHTADSRSPSSLPTRPVAVFHTAGSRATISVSEESAMKASVFLKDRQSDVDARGLIRKERGVSFALSSSDGKNSEGQGGLLSTAILRSVQEGTDTNDVMTANMRDARQYEEANRAVSIRSVTNELTPQSHNAESDCELENSIVLSHAQNPVVLGRKSLLSLDRHAISLAHHGSTSDSAENALLRASHATMEASDRPAMTHDEGMLSTDLTPTIFFPRQDAEQQFHSVAPITLSAKPKNPYLRASSEGPQDASPIPIRLHHMEGTFRGAAISPASLSRAEDVLVFGSGHVEGHARTILSVSNKKLSVDRKPFMPNAAAAGPGSEGKQVTMNDDPDVCLQFGVDPVVLAIDSVNATKLRFDGETGLPSSFFGKVPNLGLRLVGSVSDIRERLVARGCNDKLLGDKWVLNHTRWIVWKLASIERRLLASGRGNRMTLERFLDELQKRYTKELVEGGRPALRKVLNRDVSSTCMMILVVSQIFPPHIGAEKGGKSEESFSPECRLELSDNWYSIPALLDPKLSLVVQKGTISVGTKLLVCNAVLQGAEDGMDPLDDSYNPRCRSCPIALRLVANATRLARCDAKLGFVRPSRMMHVNKGALLVPKISDIVPGGGSIPLIELVVCRCYPRMFLVRDSKPREVDSLFITEAEEYMKRMELEKRRQVSIEKISDKVLKECEQEVDEMAPDVWKLLIECSSPGDYFERLSARDQSMVEKWRYKRDTMLQSLVQKELEARLEDDETLFRESTPFVRISVKSFHKSTDTRRRNRPCDGALLTVWNPTESQMGLLKEGAVVRVYSLGVRSTMIDGMLQLSANAKTQMETSPEAPATPDGLTVFGYYPRSFANMFRVHILSQKISRILLPSSPAPALDMAGIVLRAIEDEKGHNLTLHLTDESGLLVRVSPEGTNLRHSEGLTSLSCLALNNVDRPFAIAFRDLRIMQFDPIEKCAVAAYVSTSNVADFNIPRISTLVKWAKSSHGQCRLRHAAACLDLGIPMLRSSSDLNLTAIGYLADVTLPSDDEKCDDRPTHLWVHVDCGMDTLQTWEFPVHLLNTAVSICGTASDDVSLSAHVRERYEKLHSLNRVFGARGCLLRFGLLRKAEWYQVRTIYPVDTRALSTVHIALNQLQKHMEEEEKTRKRA